MTTKEYQLSETEWVCSEEGTWLVGVYESRAACHLAYEMDPALLAHLWNGKSDEDGVVPDGVNITEAELRSLVQS